MTEIVKKKIQPFKRNVHYYETDQMGIVHHSNYIRWFEEARTDFLNQIGLPYAEIESRGILVPVLFAACKYKKAVRFDDDVLIHLKITFFNGIRFKVTYIVDDANNGDVFATGETEHGFVNCNMVPVRMKKEYPDMYRLLAAYVEEDSKA